MRIDADGIICDESANGGLPGSERECVYGCGTILHMPDVALDMLNPTGRPIIPMCAPCASVYHPYATAHIQGFCPTGRHAPWDMDVPVPALAEYLGALKTPDLAEYLATLRATPAEDFSPLGPPTGG